MSVFSILAIWYGIGFFAIPFCVYLSTVVDEIDFTIGDLFAHFIFAAFGPIFLLLVVINLSGDFFDKSIFKAKSKK